MYQDPRRADSSTSFSIFSDETLSYSRPRARKSSRHSVASTRTDGTRPTTATSATSATRARDKQSILSDRPYSKYDSDSRSTYFTDVDSAERDSGTTQKSIRTSSTMYTEKPAEMKREASTVTSKSEKKKKEDQTKMAVGICLAFLFAMALTALVLGAIAVDEWNKIATSIVSDDGAIVTEPGASKADLFLRINLRESEPIVGPVPGSLENDNDIHIAADVPGGLDIQGNELGIANLGVDASKLGDVAGDGLAGGNGTKLRVRIGARPPDNELCRGWIRVVGDFTTELYTSQKSLAPTIDSALEQNRLFSASPNSAFFDGWVSNSSFAVNECSSWEVVSDSARQGQTACTTLLTLAWLFVMNAQQCFDFTECVGQPESLDWECPNSTMNGCESGELAFNEDGLLVCVRGNQLEHIPFASEGEIRLVVTTDVSQVFPGMVFLRPELFHIGQWGTISSLSPSPTEPPTEPPTPAPAPSIEPTTQSVLAVVNDGEESSKDLLQQKLLSETMWTWSFSSEEAELICYQAGFNCYIDFDRALLDAGNTAMCWGLNCEGVESPGTISDCVIYPLRYPGFRGCHSNDVGVICSFDCASEIPTNQTSS